MILLTTGSELPFNRLVEAVDTWCEANNRRDVFGQVGEIGPNDYHPKNFEWTKFLSPAEYKKHFDASEAVVAHAGMGSIISALMAAKPILIMPRRLLFRETRNDHQVATVERFASRPGVFSALTEIEVSAAMDAMLSSSMRSTARPTSNVAGKILIKTLRDFILE